MAIRGLHASLSGTLLARGEGEYEAARRVWNGVIDKHPAVIPAVLTLLMSCALSLLRLNASCCLRCVAAEVVVQGTRRAMADS